MVHFMVFIKDFVLKVLGKTMVKDHVDTKYTILLYKNNLKGSVTAGLT